MHLYSGNRRVCKSFSVAYLTIQNIRTKVTIICLCTSPQKKTSKLRNKTERSVLNVLIKVLILIITITYIAFLCYIDKYYILYVFIGAALCIKHIFIMAHPPFLFVKTIENVIRYCTVQILFFEWQFLRYGHFLRFSTQF